MRADAAQNHDRIVRSFLSLVDERRLEPTMAAVAVEADVARITLYRHFADREALRRAALVRALDDAREQLRAVIETPQPIEDALTAIVSDNVVRARQLQVLTSGYDFWDRRLNRHWLDWVHPFVEYLRAAQRRGELRDDLPAAWLADLLFWSLQAAAVGVTLRSEPDPARMVVAAFLDGARPK
jgi:AcrR family transcriptional regulator